MANSEHLKMLRQGVESWNKWREDNPDIVPDLEEVDLHGGEYPMIDFRRVKLRNANLQDTDFTMASFQAADLPLADFQGADLTMASFYGAALHSANMQKTTLLMTTFRKSLLQGSDFRGATIQHVDISEANVTAIQYDDEIRCRNILIRGAYGSQRFIRHLQDLDYIEETKERRPIISFLWMITSDYGRSWFRLAVWCCVILYLFWAFFDLLKVDHSLVTSIMAFTSFGFVDASTHSTSELVLICIEAFLGYIMFGALVSLIASQMARRSG